MALKTVADLKDSVSGLLSGLNLSSSVTGLNVALERAVRIIGNRIDVPEASGRQNYMLYDGVYDYAAPLSIFGGSVVDLRPQGVVRTPWDGDYKQPIALFDQTKAFLPNGYKITFEYNRGVGIMRVATPNVTPKVVLDPMNDTDDWTAGGSASGLAEDTTVYYQQPAALRFLLTGASTGTLTKTLSSSLDLEVYEDVGVAFLAIMIPAGTDPALLTGVSLKLGSSASAYDLVSETEGFLGAWIAGEYLLVALDFAGATSTGTPDWSALDYIQVSLTTSATITNMRVGYLFIALPQPHQLLFQSPAIFLAAASGSSPSASITLDTDSIFLNDAAFALYEQECAKTIAFQQSGGKITTQIQGFDAILDGNGVRPGLYQIYAADNPSQELRTVGSYYDGANC